MDIQISTGSKIRDNDQRHWAGGEPRIGVVAEITANDILVDWPGSRSTKIKRSVIGTETGGKKGKYTVLGGAS